MTAPRRNHVACAGPTGGHRMSWLEWGAADNPEVLLCIHGLTRCGRDFDYLASVMSHRYRVVCPDLVGRGDSDWLQQPQHYNLQQYLSDVTTLLAHLAVDRVDWLGTSLGGIIGMTLAAQGADAPVRRLILNDIGAQLGAASLQRIAAYLDEQREFDSLAQAEAHFRDIYAPFGAMSDEQWRTFTASSVKTAANGKLQLHHDPAIAVAFRNEAAARDSDADIDLWSLYDAIVCPTLVVRGENSDLLTTATVAAMRQRGPRAEAVQMPGVGHAPMFNTAAQLAPLQDFLQRR